MIAEGLSEMNDECEAIDAWLTCEPTMFKCPVCKRVREFEECVMKVCHVCQVEMKEVIYG